MLSFRCAKYYFIKRQLESLNGIYSTVFHFTRPLRPKMTISEPSRLSYKSKESLDRIDCESLIDLCFQVKEECRVVYQNTEVTTSPNYFLGSYVTAELHQHLAEVHQLLSETDFINQIRNIYSFARNYDFRDVRANGFRTFLSIISSCLAKILVHLRNLNRRTFSVWSKTTEESLIAYLRCLEELAFCILLICEFPKFSATPNTLFPQLAYANLPMAPFPSHDNLGPPMHISKLLVDICKLESFNTPLTSLSRYNELVDFFDLIHQDVFYGRAIAFYLDTSAQSFFRMLGSVMAGFADSYQCAMQGISGFVNAVFRSVTSFLSPEERGCRIAQITRSADVFFCKRFWSLAENRFLIEMPKLLLPQMAVSHSFDLPNEPVMLETEPIDGKSSTVTINPPLGDKGISVRLISKVRRRGMTWALSQGQEVKSSRPTLKKSPSKSSSAKSGSPSECPHVEVEPSPYLLIHIHGGGFIALSSETHDVYIRPWAEKLDCPIISLNYSLAPECPYPRALDECFHAMCWVMANRERLGARPDAQVVICGDSAGGNLSLGVCLRAAALGLKAEASRPGGALIAYAPAMLAYVPSPSRMLSICDPLLPIGIISRCIIAYNGIDEATIDRQVSEAANLNPSSKPNQERETKESQEKLPASDSVPLWLRLWSSWFPLSQSAVDPTNSPRLTPSIDRLRVVSRRFTSPCLYEIDANSISKSLPPNASFNCHPPAFSPARLTCHPSEPCINPLDFTTDAVSDEDRDKDENIENLEVPLTNSQANDTYTKVDAKLKCIRNCAIPQDPFLSPYIASDELFSLLPPLAIVACQYDPFLDDTLEIAKRADSLGVPVEVHVAAGMPHAFLNFSFLNADYRRATMQCVDMIARLFRGHT
ncbi:unnamed protein product [Hymenolepis diminuta]|uniref:Hormone-sensitive lipase n=1 Tax=Hymenolepis diminuta TaxID=6216 RepID=A0A564ZBA8_HYMDI|nr:unnamed protein product [Hymenolepis diminuta]